MKHLKTFETYGAEPLVKPSKPVVKPKPRRKSPVPDYKPSVKPRPKAELDDVLDLFDYVSKDKDKERLIKYYKNK